MLLHVVGMGGRPIYALSESGPCGLVCMSCRIQTNSKMQLSCATHVAHPDRPELHASSSAARN